MDQKNVNQPNFGNWVPVKMIAAPGVLGTGMPAIGACAGGLYWF